MGHRAKKHSKAVQQPRQNEHLMMTNDIPTQRRVVLKLDAEASLGESRDFQVRLEEVTACAVAAFERQRLTRLALHRAVCARDFEHELRNLVQRAVLAFDAVTEGDTLRVYGVPALSRSLRDLTLLAHRSFADMSSDERLPAPVQRETAAMDSPPRMASPQLSSCEALTVAAELD
jgi:hypothetical protein